MKPKKTTSPPVAPMMPKSDAVAPKSAAKSLVSLLLVMHFFCIFLAMAANMAPSLIELRLLRMVSPYTIAMNWQLGAVPFELTHGTELEGPWVIQTHAPDRQANQWQSVSPEQAGVSRLHLAQLCRVAGSLTAQADDDRVSNMLADVAKFVTAKKSQSIDGIRLTRLAAPEYRQWGQLQMVGKGEAMVAVDVSQPEVLFEARVLKLSSGDLALVKQQAAERSAQVVDGEDATAKQSSGTSAASPIPSNPSMLNQLLKPEDKDAQTPGGQQP